VPEAVITSAVTLVFFETDTSLSQCHDCLQHLIHIVVEVATAPYWRSIQQNEFRYGVW
jgi:hypothetical protein